MWKILKFLFSAVLLVFLVIYYFKIPVSHLTDYIQKNLPAELSSFETQVMPTLEKIQTQVMAPPPLNVNSKPSNTSGGSSLGNSQASNTSPSAGATLSDAGVFSLTNSERQQNGDGKLTENGLLDRDAELKLKDLFANQYFEHVSPKTGLGPADQAKAAGYNYIMIGENLALGNFSNNQALMDAWMASPGHRANILNVRYTEIGVAVGEGKYQGQETWIAVQEFGLPLSACPQPDPAAKTNIEKMQTQVNSVYSELSALKANIEKAGVNDPNYNQSVSSYNSLITSYNQMVTTLKTAADSYNTQVEATNKCEQGS